MVNVRAKFSALWVALMLCFWGMCCAFLAATMTPILGFTTESGQSPAELPFRVMTYHPKRAYTKYSIF
jgi:hypothetical protein